VVRELFIYYIQNIIWRITYPVVIFLQEQHFFPREIFVGSGVSQESCSSEVVFPWEDCSFEAAFPLRDCFSGAVFTRQDPCPGAIFPPGGFVHLEQYFPLRDCSSGSVFSQENFFSGAVFLRDDYSSEVIFLGGFSCGAVSPQGWSCIPMLKKITYWN
jgi:hypothetical protein